MSTGLLVLGMAIVVLVLFVGAQAWLVHRARALEGESAPLVTGPLSEVVRGDALLFFHSPTCGPCRAMEPSVNALADRDPRVHSIDVTRDTEIARAFNVMATPTTMALRDGVVREVRIGALPMRALEAMLDG